MKQGFTVNKYWESILITNKKLRDIESRSFLPDFLSGNDPKKKKALLFL